MQCPWCVSSIDDAALACPHCARDLHLYKQQQAQIAALEQQLAEHPDVVALNLRIAALETQLAEVPPERRHDTRPTGGLLLKQWLPPLVLLLAAHLLMTVIYDINTLWLRVASILIPLPFGFVLMRRGGTNFWRWCGAGFVLAVVAVLGMSWVISRVDQVPVLPASMQEWREFIEYTGSIGFAWTTGLLLGATVYRHHASKLASKLAKAASQGKDGADKIQNLAKQFNEISGTLAATATTAVSIYTGLKGFLGN